MVPDDLHAISTYTLAGRPVAGDQLVGVSSFEDLDERLPEGA